MPASVSARSAAAAHSGATAYRIAPSTWTSAAALVLGFMRGFHTIRGERNARRIVRRVTIRG